MDNDKQQLKGFNNFSKFLIIYILIAFFMFYMYQYYSGQQSVEISYSQFKELVGKNKVKSCAISEKYIKGIYIDKDGKKKRFITVVVNDPNLVKDLETHGVDFSGKVTNTWLTNLIFGWILPFGFLFFIWWLMTKKMRGTSGGLFGFGKGRFKVYLNEKPDVKFSDVAGADEAKQEIQEIVEYLRDPQKYQRLGGRAPKGVLLVGVPGVGKTLFAKATAGEAGVPFISISGSEFIEMFVGVGASRVRDLFNEAKKLSPCIVFIDEIDAIGKSRALNSLTSNDEREQTLNQLLAEMDGFDSSKGVIIMAATNRPEVLDPALLRPGRFDRQIIVDKPDVRGREAIFKVHIKKIKISPDVDIKKLAQMTPGLVGADIANIVNEAALLAARENKDAVYMEHFEEAIERQIAGLKKKNKVISEDEKKRVAYHESGHAICAYLLPGADPVHKISIIPRGLSALGYTQQLPVDDKYLLTKEEMLDKVITLLGGRAAEEIVFGSISTGAQNDLTRATDIVRALVTQFGMDEKVGLVVIEERSGGKFLTSEGIVTQENKVSEKTKELVDEEVSKMMGECYAKAKAMLISRRDKLEKLASELLKKEVINEEELKDIMEDENED
ncbi:ATP-dependent zinc metalloprotease FtsH [Hippea maritima]|uniref:ATP-dependent zinc metalloprotease FtsH n=1 Tax=Hippea maritima (strain ATCC 700847 / DSM 10411 / MH2) TaxID=760142 RepID=F2LXQ0_HIPMA|nr:ATP-dependent zinc metalloprotease FtsH [Hippea maritima]AEA34291.1 ATP-dependent metalloprotease FtsH [Hippea maritima DSM 10411]